MMMMKGTPHQPISEAPLDEEQRESKHLTPENPKEEKVPAAKTPPLKGQYVTAEVLLDCADFLYWPYEAKLTVPLNPILVDTAITGPHQEEEEGDTGVVIEVQAEVPGQLHQSQQ